MAYIDLHTHTHTHLYIYICMIKSYATAKYMMFFFRKSCAHMHIDYLQREKGGGMMPVESFFCSDLSRTGNQADRN